MNWRSIPHVAVLKVRVLDVWSKSFAPQGEAGSGVSLPTVWHSAGGRAYGESVSVFPTRFDVGIFSVACCVGVIQLVSRFLSEGILHV